MKLPDDYDAQLPSNYDLVLGFLQVFDVLLNVSQVSNDTLLKELQRQNTDYLEKLNNGLNLLQEQCVDIKNQNDKILSILYELYDRKK